MTTTDWPELDRWGGVVAYAVLGTQYGLWLPRGLQDWLRAAGGAHGQSSVVRLALLRYLAAEYPALRPELGGEDAASEH